MSETLILLEIADGVCAGARHHPAPSLWSNGRVSTLEGRLSASHGVPPETWVSACGVRGMLFVDAPILAHRAECFECRVKAARVPVVYRRYDNDDERAEARREQWRESKRRKRAAA